MIRFADDIHPPRRTIFAPTGPVRLSPTEWRLFTALYRADLEDGEWRKPAQLAAAIGPHGGRPRTPVRLADHLLRLQRSLIGTRFTLVLDRAHGIRLIVAGPPALPQRLTDDAEAVRQALRQDVIRLLDAFFRLWVSLAPGGRR